MVSSLGIAFARNARRLGAADRRRTLCGLRLSVAVTGAALVTILGLSRFGLSSFGLSRSGLSRFAFAAPLALAARTLS